MATELHERLAELADVTPPGSPPGDLWDRGVRRRRVVAASRVAVALVFFLLVGLGGWTWHASRPIEPADPQGEPHLPDRFYVPSPWVRSLESPSGALVAIGTAVRKSLLHTQLAVYGVTASSGQYGFLDLEDAASFDGRDPALSPTGRYVAYWLRSRPSDSSNADGVGGVGVYDGVTGQTRFYRQASPHGLAPWTLAWVGASDLVIDFDRWRTGGAGGAADTPSALRWSMGSPSPRPLSASVTEHVDPSAGITSSGNGTWLVAPFLVDKADRVVRISGVGTPYGAEVSPGRHWLAALHGRGSPSRVAVHVLVSKGRNRIHATPVRLLPTQQKYLSLLGWVDEDHLAGEAAAPGATFRRLVVALDVRTGETTTLVRPGSLPILATGFLDAPIVPASPPPHPLDRRWLAGGTLLCVAVVVLYLVGAARVRRA